jgi:hypothetical protein
MCIFIVKLWNVTQKTTLELQNGNSIVPIHVLFFCPITAVIIFIVIYLLVFLRSVLDSFNFFVRRGRNPSLWGHFVLGTAIL